MVCQPMLPSDPCRVFTSYARSDGAANRKVFLSYAWKDDQRFVKRLYRDLKRDGYDPWMDVQNMPSRGRTLPQEVIDNLSACERLIAIIGPHWLASPACQAESKYATRIGKVISPILRAGQYEELPTELTKLFILDFRQSRPYKEALEELLRVIAEPAASPGALLGVPTLPSNYQARMEDLQAVRDAMEIRDLKPIAILSAKHNVALQGMSGIGKTVLAIAYAHDYEARRSFPDGIVWLTVRREPNLGSLIHLAGSALHANLDQYTEVEEAKAQLQRALQDKACLLVLDDVWDFKHAQAFLDVLGPRCRLLLTTRDGGLANKLEAHVWHVDRLEDETARSLLAESAGIAVDSLPAEADDVRQECGNLPFPLAQSGAVIRNGNSWRDLLDALRKADVSYFAERLPNYEYPDVFKSIQVSLDFLARQDAAAANRYRELAVFPPTNIPEAAAVTLWTRDGDLTEPHARKLITTLHNVALIERVEGRSPKRRFSLHDLQFDFMRAAAGKIRDLHETLLKAYRAKCADGWPSGPKDEYFFQYLSHHLKEAGHEEELRSLLLNAEWLQAKLAATDVTALTADFGFLKTDENLLLVQGAVSLSANVIGRDPQQFSSQMVGRLVPYCDRRTIASFTRRVAEGAPGPWLRELHPALHPPGTALLRTLEGHSDSVYGVAVTPDGKRAVSASGDKTLKVWDLASGRELRTLTGHKSGVTAVAVTPDGQRAVSASRDGTLKVWDLKSGRALRTLKGHEGEVNAVAVTPDGQRALSASNDYAWVDEVPVEEVKVWELSSGQELRSPTGCWGLAVAVMPDGQYAVSTSHDGTLKLWELHSGRELRILTGHTDIVCAVAVTPDGQHAISASYDKTLKVWELGSGRPPKGGTLAGHRRPVTGVAVSGDGRLAVSASDDRTLRVWDVASGRTLHTLAGHWDYVRAVAVTPDGQRALSTSYDGTLKVWELSSGRTLHTHKVSSSIVTPVAVTPDGQRALSTSYDGTLKVWELSSGRTLHTLKVSPSVVTAVAVSGDGRRAISASGDDTLKVWEVESGRELRTLEGHTRYVSGVALSGDGRRAVSASDDRTLKVWDLETGKVLATFTCDAAANCCAFSEALRLIVAGDAGGHVHFLRLEDRKRRSDRSLTGR